MIPFALVPLLMAMLCGVASRQQPHPSLRLLGFGALAAALGLPFSMPAPATAFPALGQAAVALDLLAASCFWQATSRSFGGRPSPVWLAVPSAVWLIGSSWLAVSGAASRLPALAGAVGIVPVGLSLTALPRARRRRPAGRGLIVVGIAHLLCMTWLAASGPVGDGRSWHGLIASVLPAELLGWVVLWPGLSMLLILDGAFLREQARALHDELSGVLNRRGFWRAAETIEHRGILLFDIDHFKHINDTSGHAAGDAVILRFTQIATAILGDRAIFGRIGGEEFAAAFDGATVAEARGHAEDIRVAFAAAEPGDGVPATVSIGLSIATGRQALNDQMAFADRALYRAKQLGRNRTVLHVGDSSGLPSGEPAADREPPEPCPDGVRRRARRDAR